MTAFELPRYPFVRPADLDTVTGPLCYPVVIIGAGLTGLTLALDLVRRGQRVLVLDDDDTVGVRGLASRGIVWAQRTLDIFHRLGVGEKIVSKGVTWNVGRVLCRDAEVASFRLQQEPDLRFNGFTNLQQYYVEQFLVDTLRATGQAELRWLNRVEEVRPGGDTEPIELEVSTPEGRYRMLADWVVGCDGSSSRVRDCLGLAPVVFDRTEDRWIIIDIVAKNADIPEERWTWLDCSANFGRAVWRHRMADGTWRLDFQMSPHEDAEQAASEAGMRERVRRRWGLTWRLTSPGRVSGSIGMRVSRPIATAGCCLRGMPPMWCRRLARAEVTVASRTPMRWAGACRWCCRAVLRRRCSITTAKSAIRLPWKTSARPGARRALFILPTSLRRRSGVRRSWRSPTDIRSRHE